jgi:hypothetical protein
MFPRRWPAVAALAIALVGGLMAWSVGLILPAPAPVQAALCNGIPCYTFTVTLGGDGSGSYVTTNSAGTPDGIINCQQVNGVVTASSTCSWLYKDFGLGINLHVRIAPATGSCNSFHTSCTTGTAIGNFTLTADTEVVVIYNLMTFSLTINGQGGDLDLVVHPGGGCNAPACVYNFKYGTAVDLTDYPPSGTIFLGWLGACAGQGATCLLTINGDLSTTAVLGPATYSLHLVVNGSGNVTSNPAGISCNGSGGSGCTHSFGNGQTVSLAATGAAGNTWSSWGAECATQANPCSVTMSSDQTASAFFVALPATPRPTSSPTPRPTAIPTAHPTSTPTGNPAPTASPPPASSPAATGTPVPGQPSGSIQPSAAASDGSGGLVPSASPPSSSLNPAPSGDIAAVSSPSAAPSGGPDLVPAVAPGQVDLTPVVIAIVFAGLLIALGIVIATVLTSRRRRGA